MRLERGTVGSSGVRRSAVQRQRRAEARKKKQIRNLLIGIFLGLCICLLLFSAWKLISILLESRSGSGEYKDLKQYVEEDSLDLAALQEINSDAVGWIEIPDTKVSYPLVHNADNSFYLTHTFSGDKNKAGGIFIEASNSPSFTDLHTIVYGQNMKNGSMFGSLKKYEKESYLEKHPNIYIHLADGTYTYQIFSVHEADPSNVTYSVGYAADSQYEEFLNTIKSASLYDTGVEVGIDDTVISLTTCGNDTRFVVHAKKID